MVCGFRRQTQSLFEPLSASVQQHHGPHFDLACMCFLIDFILLHGVRDFISRFHGSATQQTFVEPLQSASYRQQKIAIGIVFLSQLGAHSLGQN